jgi:hypothetical protein
MTYALRKGFVEAGKSQGILYLPCILANPAAWILVAPLQFLSSGYRDTRVLTLSGTEVN